MTIRTTWVGIWLSMSGWAPTHTSSSWAGVSKLRWLPTWSRKEANPKSDCSLWLKVFFGSPGGRGVSPALQVSSQNLGSFGYASEQNPWSSRTTRASLAMIRIGKSEGAATSSLQACPNYVSRNCARRSLSSAHLAGVRVVTAESPFPQRNSWIVC